MSPPSLVAIPLSCCHPPPLLSSPSLIGVPLSCRCPPLLSLSPCQHCHWVIMVGSWNHFSSWWGPGAHSSFSSVPAVIHSLPNLQAGACSGGSGQGVSSTSFASSSPIVRSSCCFELHLFPPHKQLLMAVVLCADLVVVQASL